MVDVSVRTEPSRLLNKGAQTHGRQVPDWIVVPAIGFKMPAPLEAAVARPDIRDASDCASRMIALRAR